LLGEQLENGKILIFICNVVLRDKNAKTTLQEVLNEIVFSRFLEQVDSKIWRLHLLIFNGEMIWELMITY